MIHDTMLVVGFGCVVAGACLLSLPLGLIAFGIPLVAFAMAKKRKETNVDS